MFAFATSVIRLIRAILKSWHVPRFKTGLALAVLILFSGTLFYRQVEGWSWVDSLYFCAVTVSTVGSADFAPRTDFGKMFTVLYIFVGVGVFINLFMQFARALLHIEKQEDKGQH
ncbi:potassium channel family protein [Roseibium alexandrii]|uniref:Ion channel n=1 Tax=Roseibium alexandrii (strain DSM 17067 / NCIMB 14079 / DFL-11) TaxID=244592 RepID=A0A5E8GXB9_ROSAD|nr:potassium channel family protein [Roseibium alexandrii]EEE44093.1 Ion channel [Roseibium alexandrii DFL-11]